MYKFIVEIIKVLFDLDFQLKILRLIKVVCCKDIYFLKEYLRLAIRLRDKQMEVECIDELLSLDSKHKLLILLWYLNIIKAWFNPIYGFQSVVIDRINDVWVMKELLLAYVQVHNRSGATVVFDNLLHTRHSERFLEALVFDVLIKTSSLDLSYFTDKRSAEVEANITFLARKINQVKIRHHLPFSHISNQANDKFDLVYTWIDNKKWESEFAHLMCQNDFHRNEERYSNNWEIVYSIWSMHKFCKKNISSIYIVTNDYFDIELIPKEFQNKVFFVSHKEILPCYVKIPTFNSNIIEFFLHRIPGLSEKFIYANDDMMIYSQVTYDDFFTDNGRGISYFRPIRKQRHRWRCFSHKTYIHPLIWYRNTSDIFQRVACEDPCYTPIHQIMAMRKEVGVWMEESCVPHLHKFFKNQFRSNTDIKTIMLLDWIGIYLGFLVQGDFQKIQDESLMFAHGFNEYSVEAIKTLEPKFLCVNIDEFNRNHFWKLMDERLGEKISDRLPA